MANAQTPFVPRDGSLTFSDGAGTPLTYTVQYEDGDFSVSGLNDSTYAKQSFKSRGKTYSVRDVEDQEIEFSFTCHAIALVGDGTTATVGDVVLKEGAWASATSTLPAANGDSYCVSLTWTGERTNFGASSDSSITLKYCALSMDFSEGVAGKLSIKGVAYPISTDFRTIA